MFFEAERYKLINSLTFLYAERYKLINNQIFLSLIQLLVQLIYYRVVIPVKTHLRIIVTPVFQSNICTKFEEI